MKGDFHCHQCDVKHPRTKEYFYFTRRKRVTYCRNPIRKRVLKPHREKDRKDHRRRVKRDSFYRKKRRLRSKFQGFIKSIDGKMDCVGLNAVDCRRYISSMFRQGMSWSNHGDWHIDHIVPLASAETEEELETLFYYTNLRPLWAHENMSKGSKV
jgi:hypothetical protein